MATKYYVEFFRYVENVDEPEVALAIPSAFADIPTAISQGALMFATIKSSHNADGFQIREDHGRIVARRFAGDFDA